MEVIRKGGIFSTTANKQPASWKTKVNKANELTKRILSVSGTNSAKQRQENLQTLRAKPRGQPQVRRSSFKRQALKLFTERS